MLQLPLLSLPKRLSVAIVATCVAVTAAIAIAKKYPSGCPLQLSLLYSVAVAAAVIAQAVVRCNCRYYIVAIAAAIAIAKKYPSGCPLQLSLL